MSERTLAWARRSGAASGVKVERGDAMVTTFRDDLVVRIDYYNSHAEALAAAGPAE